MIKSLGLIVAVLLITLAVWHFVPTSPQQNVQNQISRSSSAAAVILAEQESETPKKIMPLPAPELNKIQYHDPAWPPAYLSNMKNPPQLPFYPENH